MSGYDVTNVYMHPWPALTMPALGFRFHPLLKVEASVEEQHTHIPQNYIPERAQEPNTKPHMGVHRYFLSSVDFMAVSL